MLYLNNKAYEHNRLGILSIRKENRNTIVYIIACVSRLMYICQISYKIFDKFTSI